jgi:hypothetical protein
VESAAAQPKLLALVERIAAGEGDAYELAWDLYREAMQAVGPGGPNGERAFVIYRIWTGFDDLSGHGGLRGPEIEDAMRSAAEEWLAIHDSGPDAWGGYYERWLVSLKALAATR